MANVGKTLAKIRVTVESGAYYEAQQLYKSVYYRHKARKQMEESFQILQVGAGRAWAGRLRVGGGRCEWEGG